MRWRVWLGAGGVIALMAGLPAGQAQSNSLRVENLFSRPTERGPSQRIGSYYAGAGPRLPAFSNMTPNVALIGESQFQASGWRNRYLHAARALQAERLGLGRLSAPPPGISIVPESLGRGSDASMLWGLDSRSGMSLPVAGMGLESIEVVDTRSYVNGPTGTPFHRYFGLQPAAPVAEPTGQPMASLTDRLAGQTAERVQAVEREGLELFKAATVESRDPRTNRYPNCQDCEEKLAQAVHRLTLVRDLDPQSFLPCLLLAHAALEQERPRTALRCLVDALDRNPDLFVASAEPLARHFGDVTSADRSAYLDAQMRRYREIGSLNQDSVEAQVLAMYCAWRLDDMPRARDAADRVANLAGPEPERYTDAVKLVAALQAAVR